MRVPIHRSWLGLWLMLCAGASQQPAVATTVAVMDFATPSNDVGLAWARLGIPDLLTVELSSRGWEVLDRESIDQVLQEQSLTDAIQAGHLVGAKYVITGKTTSPAPGQITIEAVLANVESLESGKSTGRTGQYPEDVGKLIQQIAEEMTRTGDVASAPIAASRVAWIPRPETVISFNRGLAAFSAGYPEIAVPWFIISYRMEPKFALARAWEVHAYEAMGFKDLAQCAREKHGEKLTGPSSAVPEKTKFVALSRPLLAPADAWSTEQVNEIMQAFSDGLMKVSRVSLINPEAIEHAIREQDFQLGGFFAGGTTARYGQWRMPDGILQSRFERRNNDVLIQLWIDAPTAANVAPHETEAVAPDALPRELIRMIGQLLSTWQAASAAAASAAGPKAVPMTEADLADMSEPYRPLARALHQLRQREGFEEWRALAEAYNQIGIWLMAGAAVDQAIAHIDLDAPDADRVLLHAWADFKVMTERGCQPMYMATPGSIFGLQSNLLARFPYSACATAMRFENGWQAWRKQQFAEAEDWMRNALAGLTSGRSTDEDEAILAAKYLLADSLNRGGKPEEALPIFRELNECMMQHPHGDDSLPSTLMVDENRRFACGERCKLSVVGHIRNAVAGRKSNRNNHPPKTKLRAAAFYNPDGRCEGRLTKETVMPAMNALVEAWQTVGPFEICGTSDLNIALNWLCQMAEMIGEEERREWFPNLVRAYLHCMKVKSAWDPEKFVPADVVPHVGHLWLFYCMAGLRQDGLAFLDLFLEPDVAPTTAFDALMQADSQFAATDLVIDELEPRLARLAGRLPGGERDVPGNLWAQLAEQHALAGDWAGATIALKKGFASAKPPRPGGETARIMINRAAGRPGEDLHAAVKAECAEWSLLPWIPRWWQWYNEGCRASADGKYDLAVACYQVVLRYLDAPQEMDPTLRIEPSPDGPPHAQQGDAWDSYWISDLGNRRNSAKFRMALAFLALHKPEPAAILLREVALDVGQDQAEFYLEFRSDGHSLMDIHMGVIASTLLHSLHLLNEIQWADMPVLDRAAVARQCIAAGRELQHANLQKEARIFYDAKDRLLSR